MTDIYRDQVARAVDELGAIAVAPEDIYGLDVDVFAPCAMGAILNDVTIPQLRARVIAGAANNQLSEARHGTELMERDILYAPDYVINAGGIIDVWYERRGWFDRDAMVRHIEGIGGTLSENLHPRQQRRPAHQHGRRPGRRRTLPQGRDLAPPPAPRPEPRMTRPDARPLPRGLCRRADLSAPGGCGSTRSGSRASPHEFDPQPFHLDEEAARRSVFRGLAASGWHTAAVTMRLLVESELKPAGGIVGIGFDEFRWPRPVRPGDELRVESEVLEVRPSNSRPDQGLIKVRTTTLNQKDEPVQIQVANLLVPRQPA